MKTHTHTKEEEKEKEKKDYFFQLCEESPCIFFFKILFIYSGETQREREAETQAEGEAGSMQGA